jgi:formylglycine-generating enzyme required for sulfatase activity
MRISKEISVFSRFVIEGLKGKADKTTGNNDGIVSFFELSSFVDEEVAGWALKKSKKQRPYTQILGEKYGDLALSAYAKTGVPVEPGEPEKKQEEKPTAAKVEENVSQKEERITGPADDKPDEVKAVETKAVRVYKNDKGYWEADYGDGIIMVYIPAGEFLMGSDDGRGNEKPVHKVYLDGYWLGKTEVTVKQFRSFVNEMKYKTEAEKDKDHRNWKNPGFKQEDNHPVVYVSWNDAVNYCQWLYETKGLNFTMPTEAQWEKGARGTDGRKYPWGNHEPYENGKYYANYDPGNYTLDGFYYTAPVGWYLHGASPYGLLDMVGNVFEWCNDWYHPDYYKNSPLKNPTGPGSAFFRVVRSSDWAIVAGDMRCTSRGGNVPGDGYSSLGFRLAQCGR